MPSIILKILLLLNLLGGTLRIVDRINNNLILQVILFYINLIIFIILWRAVNKVFKHSATNFQRWSLYLYTSIWTVMIGVWVMFLIRFFLDRALLTGGRSINPVISFITSYGGFVLSLYPLHLLAKMVKFTRPWKTAIITFTLWAFFILAINLNNQIYR